MDTLIQKTIDQYLDGMELDGDKKVKVLTAITHMVYSRNQNVIKAEAESDEVKKKQFVDSVNEYDQMINNEIKDILDGKEVITYDF